MKKRVSVYVDGFNLYHALDDLNVDHLKWVDLWALSEKLIRPNEAISCVKYFTAYATWRPSSYRRHQHYTAALEANGVTLVLGRFKSKTLRCRGACGQNFRTHEEKETDVNIGVHLMADALQDRFDRAIVISADTDLNAAVSLVRSESKGKLVDIAAPPRRKGRNSSALFEVTVGRVKASLLPGKLTHPDGREITRPYEYAPPAA